MRGTLAHFGDFFLGRGCCHWMMNPGEDGGKNVMAHFLMVPSSRVCSPFERVVMMITHEEEQFERPSYNHAGRTSRCGNDKSTFSFSLSLLLIVIMKTRSTFITNKQRVLLNPAASRPNDNWLTTFHHPVERIKSNDPALVQTTFASAVLLHYTFSSRRLIYVPKYSTAHTPNNFGPLIC